MPEINLKAYFVKLNGLLSTNAADEVIHHCRHILHYYPKNVIAYRLMGRALINNGRWQEGREVLLRVLGVIPDDYAAHLGLSEANERENHPDAAIWHLERAFEQRPNDKDLIDALRALYRRYRQIDNLKIQLTSAAVARQYMRSGSYAQAVDTLRSALARMTDRLDLKLLLAQILWQQGSEEEAAEIALEVLKVLPDCLEANRIMAALWLSVDRPSDAQRYVNRLESVDPYSAVELVQGYPPDDDVFRIEELDYSRSARSELTSARPDWLQEISSEASAAVSTDSGSAGSASSNGGHDDEWSNWASAMLNTQTQDQPSAEPVSKSSTDLPTQPPRSGSLLSNNPPARQESAPDNPIMTSGLTDLFGSPDDAQADELSALFENGDVGDDDDQGDAMAWLSDSGVEIVEEDEQPDYDTLLGVNDPFSAPEADGDSMAWLQSAAGDLVIDDETSESGFGDEDVTDENDDDPFAWMREADADEDEDESSEKPGVSLFEDAADDSFELAYAESLFADSLDDSSDSVAADDVTDQPADQLGDDWELPEFDSVMGDDQAPTDADNVAIIDESDAAEQPVAPEDAADTVDNTAVPGPRRGLTAILQDANLDWMQSSQDDEVVSDDEMDEWLNQFGGSSEPAAKVTDTPDWLTAIDDDANFVEEAATDEADDEDDGDWLAQVDVDDDVPVGDFEPDVVDSKPDWLNTGLASDQQLSEEDEETGDWLAEFAPEQADEAPETSEALGAADDFTWMSDEALAEPQSGAEMTDVEMTDEQLDQYTEHLQVAMGVDDVEDTPYAEDVVEEEAVGEPTLEEPTLEEPMLEEPMLEEPTLEEPTLDELEFDERPDLVQPADAMADTELIADSADEEAPDWVSGLEPEANEPEDVTDTTMSDNEFDWLNKPDSEADDQAEFDEETPDWLSELNAVSGAAVDADAESDPEATALDQEFGWLDDTTDAPDDGEAEEIEAATEMPDWMSELAPVDMAGDQAADQDDDAETELEWMGELSAEDDADADQVIGEAAIAEEVPDWLDELKPEDQEPQPESETDQSTEAVSDDDFAWMDESGEEDEEPVVAEMPDWMSELAPQPNAAEFEEDEESEEDDAEFAHELDWMTADLDDDEEEVEPAEPVEDEDIAIAEDMPDWMSELAPEDDAIAEPQMSADDEEPEPETGAEAADSELEQELAWMSDESSDEDEAIAVAEDMPDWMSELAPEDDAVTEPQGSAEAETGAEAADSELEQELAWMGEELPDDDEEAVAAEMPDWMSELAPDQAEPPDQEDAEADVDTELEWMGTLSTVDEEEAAAVAEDAPDWLSELEPGAADDEPEALPETQPEGDLLDEDWLNEPAAEAEDDAVAAEMPDWISELEPEADQSEPAEPMILDENEQEADEEAEEPLSEEEEVLGESYGWLNEPAAEADEEAAVVAEEVPDWLSDDEGERIAAEVLGDSAAEATESEEVDDFEWLNDGVSESELNDEDFQEEVEPAVAFDESVEFDDNQTELESLADADEGESGELEPAPAHNAPDWLNAMVPGLDVEYDVADELGDEEEPVEEPEAEANGEIAWLVDLVDEEAAVAEPANFAFTQPPAWMSSASQSAAPDTDDDDFPDWPTDEIDDDTPEWLR